MSLIQIAIRNNFKLINLKSNGRILFALHRSLFVTQSQTNASKASKPAPESNDELVYTGERKKFTELSTAEKVKETTKTFSYSIVILFGIGVLGLIVYTLSVELFSSDSPSNVYDKAFRIIKDDYRVQGLLGIPVKAYGAESHRRRTRHTADHVVYEENGKTMMSMRFKAVGNRQRATVILLAEKDSTTKHFEIVFLKLTSDLDPRKFLIVVDMLENEK